MNATRNKLLSNETGLKFEGSELSPFFGIGITFENFQIFENFPSLKDLLNKKRYDTQCHIN